MNTNEIVPKNKEFFRLVLGHLPIGMPVDTVNGLGWYRRLNRNDFCLFDKANKERSRWGDINQIAEDLAFFEANGHLPPADMPRW